MKLHWSPRSPFVRKVMIAAHELDLTALIEPVRSIAMLSRPNPAIIADNPLSKIPTLVLDDGEAIFDSLTICEYLDGLAGGARLFPTTLPERARVLTWHALGNGLLDLLVLWRNESEKPLEKQTSEWLDAFAVKTTATLDRLNQTTHALERSTFSVGHISIGCALSYLDFRFNDLGWRNGRPCLSAWHHSFRQRPSVIATEIVDA